VSREPEYSTIISPPVPIHTDDSVPDGSPRRWSPITSTLITGERDAVLIDPPLTIAQASAVTEWVAASGKRLTAVYSTHGHGDHWFGTSTVLARFPSAVHYATSGAIEMMRTLSTPEQRRDRWDVQFPGQIGDLTVRAVPPPGGIIDLEGHDLVPVEVGHTDTDGTTVLHVPALDLVVAGDVVYANLHQSLHEGSSPAIHAWLAALDAVATLNPLHVVSGHKDPSADDSPRQIEETRGYLLDVLSLLGTRMSPRDFFWAMVRRRPTRLNTGALWSSAQTLFASDEGAPIYRCR
jgi:glyoxylase-like metal-dependent hydrolase (beta-lactamase superfamily II)